MTLIAIVHMTVAILLVILVLIQDSKSGAVSGTFGGGGSNSLLGATGATTLANKATRIAAIIFAMTCIILTRMSTADRGSALDKQELAPSEKVQQTLPPAPVEQKPAPQTPPGN